MRQITKIIWHCSATKEGQDVSMEAIRDWHVTGNGWSDIGYHYVIELDGRVREGRPVERVGAHVKGENGRSIGICYVGGIDASETPKDTRTPAQKTALYELTTDLLERFPGATIHGHNEFAAKACPSFNVQSDWANYVSTLPIVSDPSSDLD